MITRLIYSSHATKFMSMDDIQSILASAKRFNAPNHITGMLCHGNNVFLQYFEGNEEVVDKLYDRIARDNRHKDIRILHRSTGDFPRFTNWSMGFVSSYDSPVMEMLQEKTGINIFQVDTLNATEALSVIYKLKEMLELQQGNDEPPRS